MNSGDLKKIPVKEGMRSTGRMISSASASFVD